VRRIDPLWRGAPGVLLHFKALFVAVAGAALILALAVSAGPLLLSTSASNAVQDAVDDVSTYGAGVALVKVDRTYLPGTRDLTFVPRDEALRERLGGIPHLGDRKLALLSGPQDIRTDGGGDSQVRLLSKTDVLDNVTIVEDGGPSEGVWVSDATADSIGAEMGDVVTIGSVELPIEGIYKARFREPAAPYWRTLYNAIYPRCDDCSPPPPFALVEQDQMIQLAGELRFPALEQHWQFPLADPSTLTLEQTREVVAELEDFELELFSNEGIGEFFACTRICQNYTGSRIDYTSRLSAALDAATSELASIDGPLRLLSIAGTIVAAAVVAAAGYFLTARRKTELDWMFARGFSPLRIAGKVWLESLLPVSTGVALGSLLTLGAVRLFSQGNPVDPSAIATAAISAVIAIPSAAALVALVTTIFYGRSPIRTREERWWSAIPFEIVLIVLAAWSYKRLSDGGGLVGGSNGTPQGSLHLSLFPLALIGVVAGLGARAVVAALSRRRGRGARNPALYLATRRMAGATGLVRMLLTSCSVALGVFAYSHSLVGSIDRSMYVKSEIGTGADVAATIRPDQEADPDFPFPVTKVTTITNIRSDDDRVLDLLVVDPETFADAAFWESSFSARSLEDLMRDLAAPGGSAVPAIVVGDTGELRGLDVDGISVPIDVVARPKAFPGMSKVAPLVVASVEPLRTAFEADDGADPMRTPGVVTELWLRGDPNAVSASLRAANSVPYDIFTAEEVRSGPETKAITATFASLRLLGAGVGILSVVGLLLYLQARQRARILSNSLSGRMGLRRRDRALALLFEIGMLLTFAVLAGGLGGIAAGRLVLGHVDPRPEIAPDPVFEPSVPSLVALGIALIVVSLLGGLVAHRRTERSDVAAVMRVA
jgi:hypothetical protein